MIMPDMRRFLLGDNRPRNHHFKNYGYRTYDGLFVNYYIVATLS